MSRTIMVVEEGDIARAIQKDSLAKQYGVLEACDGMAAFKLLNDNVAEIECVLLSLTCEGAFEFLFQKRSAMLLHAIPVIGILASDDDPDAIRALEADVTDFITRPIRDILLLQRVRNLVRLRENTSLRRALERDPLTGIFNRHTFARRTAKLLRKKVNEQYHLQVWDVEHFKIVNDLKGLAMGDRVLRAIAHYLDGELRGVGTYARLESDLFALCYPAQYLEPKVLLAGVNQMLQVMDIGVRLMVYAGLYIVEDVNLSVDQMCDRARMALQTVKGKTQEYFALYDHAMRDRLILEQSIASEMHKALAQGQFYFELQPLYSITTGAPNSAEALVRWNHPVKGIIPPGDFIPLFESNGFITQLDAWVWESVCTMLQAFQREGFAMLPVSVNVSRHNFENPNFCDELLALVNRHELQPSALRLEITESAYTESPRHLIAAIKALQQSGFEILMDDFGNGYSSLSMLKDLPVDILKVDMRFLEGVENNGRAANVMASITRMAKWLNITVVAEGVESQAQIEFLRSIGCDEVQGYFYARPMSVDAFRMLISDPASAYRGYQIDRDRLLNDFDFQTIWESNRQAEIFFNDMIGAIGLYEKTGDTLEVLRVNDSYYELMGSTPQSLMDNSKNVLEKLRVSDREALLSTCDRAADTHIVEQLQIRCPHTDGHIMWLDIKVRHLGTIGTQKLFSFALYDASKQKELERNLLLYQYGAALVDAYSEVLEMNFTDNIATGFTLNGVTAGYQTHNATLDEVLHTMAETRIHPEEQALFTSTCCRDYLDQAFQQQGRRSVSIELRICQPGQPYHWARLTLHPMVDPSNKFRTLCCTRNIDEQKQSESMRADYAILQAKQQEQERYRVILEQTQTALLAWTPATEKAEGNALAQKYRMSGVSFSALQACDLPATVVDAEDMITFRAFLRSLHNNESSSCLVRLMLTNGVARWCKLCVTVQRDDHRQVIAILATINNVDHEQRIQLQLDAQREQNERRLSMLSHLYWTLPCCILQLDLSDPPKPIFFNRACWVLFGFETKEVFDAIADRDLFSLIASDEREDFLERLRNCRDHNTVENIDITVVRPDGRLGSLRGNAAMSHTSDGRPMVQLVLLDTTVQREQETRLERTRATLLRTTDMLQHLMENLPVGVTLFEFGTLVNTLYINSRAYNMFGLKDHQPHRLLELMRLDSFHINSDMSVRNMQMMDDHGISMSGVTRVERADGSSFWLRIYYSMVPQDTTPPLCYAVLVDVSRQMEVERAFNRQNELYRIMMEDSHQIFFDYDLEKDEMIYSIRTLANQREDRVVPNFQKTIKQSNVVLPSHISGFVAVLRRYSRIRTPGTFEYMANYYGTGEYRWYRAHFRTLADESGLLYRMIGRVSDIQEEKQRDEQLGQASVFRRAVDSVSLFVFSFDLPNMVCKLLSCEDPKRTGFHPYLEYLTPERMETLIHPDEYATFRDALDAQLLTAAFRNRQVEHSISFRALNQEGSWIWLEMTIHLSGGETRTAINGIGYVKVIEERKELERKASFDGLTQLLNRATVEERAERLLCEEEGPCCLMIFDVDDFKSVNDLLGHRAGDALLRDVASVVRSHFRQSDIVGRLGGDEFVALLRGATEEIAAEKGKELLQAIRQLNDKPTEEQRAVTISIGFACAPEYGRTFAELYAAADTALYEAKRNGKNRCSSATRDE